MFRRTVLAGMTAFSLTPLPAQPAENAGQAVEQFYRLCLAEGPNFDRLILTADDRDWEPIAEPAFSKMAPVANPTSVRVWLVDKEEEEGLAAGAIIGASRAQMNGKPVQTCTVAFPDIDHEAFRKSFFDRTDAEKIAEDRDAAQTSRLYIFSGGGREQFVRLMNLPSASPGNPAVVASSIMPD